MVLLTCLTTYRLARCNKSLRNLSAFAVMGLRCQIVILSGLILLRQGSWHRPLRTQLPIPFPISDKLAGFRLLSVWLVGCHRQKKEQRAIASGTRTIEFTEVSPARQCYQLPVATGFPPIVSDGYLLLFSTLPRHPLLQSLHVSARLCSPHLQWRWSSPTDPLYS